MKEASVDIGKVYALRSQTGGEVTDENGNILETLEPNVQLRTMAQEQKWLVPDDCKVTKGNFKRALAALFLLGEGNTLPAGYKRLEYLEGTGEQFLNVPREWKQPDSLRLEYVSTQERPNENIFGANDSYRAINTPNYIRIMVAGKYYDFTKAVQWAKNIVTIDAQKVTANGREIKRAADEVWDNAAAEYKIFTNNKLQYKGTFRLLRFEHLSDTKLILIPALDATGAPCMFDTVSRKPFYNSGTGDFVTPQSGARTYSLRGRCVLPDWGKLTENGLRRLYHAPAGYKGDAYDYALEHGYKPIVESEHPEVGYWVPVWHETEDSIQLEWVETEPPAEELSTIE